MYSQQNQCVTKDDILKTYPSAFQGIRTFKGQYRLAVKESAEPVVHPTKKNSSRPKGETK